LAKALDTCGNNPDVQEGIPFYSAVLRVAVKSSASAPVAVYVEAECTNVADMISGYGAGPQDIPDLRTGVWADPSNRAGGDVTMTCWWNPETPDSHCILSKRNYR
jgi:hypothetical protein